MGAYFLLAMLLNPSFWGNISEKPNNSNSKYVYIDMGIDTNGYNNIGFGIITFDQKEHKKTTFILDYKIPNDPSLYYFDKVGFDFQKTFFNDTFGIGGGVSAISRYDNNLVTEKITLGFSLPISLSYRVSEHFYLDVNYSLLGAYFVKNINTSSETINYYSTNLSLQYLF